MTASATQALITGAVTDFGASVLVIITATLAIGLAYLVFRFGWRKLKMELNTAPRGVNAYFTSKRYGRTKSGERYDTWAS